MQFVVTVVETDGNFEREIPTIDGFTRVSSKCRITGHYRDKESQPVYLYCNDVGPLAGIDRAPDRQPITVGEPMESKVETIQQAKQILESVGLILEKNVTISDFVTYLKQNGLTASMDGGEKFYCVRRLNHDNFDLSQRPNFLKQITDEGLYNRSFVSVIADKDKLDKKFSVDSLPIFGRTDKYETKWLRCYSPEDTVEQDFRDRRMSLKKRLDFFKVPEDEALSLNVLKAALESQVDLPCKIKNNYKKGDYLETTLDFTREECEEFGTIPTSSGYYIVWLINNNFVINKKKFGSVEKVVNFFKENKEYRAQLG